jgi:hypothetical protein
MKLTLLLLLLALPVHAKDIAQATDRGVVVTLTDEPCTLNAVSNLPYRATWAQDGKTSEACFALMGPFVVLYFQVDSTVGLAQTSDFKMLTGV